MGSRTHLNLDLACLWLLQRTVALQNHEDLVSAQKVMDPADP
jgi:hypothetical protein